MINNNKLYLSLDVSTTTIGICLLEDNGTKMGKILELTHINPKISSKIKGIECLFLKKRIFKEFIAKYKSIEIDHCIIEEPLVKSNNALTVTSLVRFNGMISDCVYEELGLVPEYISSYEAREYSFPSLMAIRKYGKDGKQYEDKKIIKEINNSNLVLFGSYPWTIDKKTVIQSMVAESFPDIEWLYNKKGELKKQNFDSSDAYVAALGYINKNKYGKLEFSTDDIKITNNDDGKPIKVEYNVKYWDKVEPRTTFID